MVKGFLCSMAFALCPMIASAQGVTGVNPVYIRAQAMVNDGNAATGRALIDSMVAVAPPGSNEYAEAVYWRAVLAATAADAETDYRRIVVEFSMSPRVEDALIRLAQLEIARANYDGALRHLNRLIAEHPESPARPRAGYWMARALFDKNDVQGGCVATADALSRTREDDAELRNQITYLNQRCAGVVIADPSQPVTTAPVVTVPPAAPPAAAPPVTETVSQPVAPAPTTASRDSATRPPAAAVTRTPAVRTPPAGNRDAKGGWSVQVAAYNLKSQADAMVTRLKKNGYEARVDGTVAPFRVRIGRYATQGQASAVQRSLKAKQVEGFVVQVDLR